MWTARHANKTGNVHFEARFRRPLCRTVNLSDMQSLIQLLRSPTTVRCSSTTIKTCTNRTNRYIHRANFTQQHIQIATSGINKVVCIVLYYKEACFLKVFSSDQLPEHVQKLLPVLVHGSFSFRKCILVGNIYNKIQRGLFLKNTPGLYVIMLVCIKCILIVFLLTDFCVCDF